MNANGELGFRAPAHWIDGQLIPFDGPVIEVVNPTTETVIVTVPDGKADDVDRAVAAATATWPGGPAGDGRRGYRLRCGGFPLDRGDR